MARDEFRLALRTSVPCLRRVLAAWAAVVDAGGEAYLIGDGVGVDDAEVREFERAEGLTVPPALRSLLEIDRQGIEVTALSIEIDGWPPESLSNSGVPVDPVREPHQLRWLGTDLGEDVWMLWLPPQGATTPAPVVVMRDYDDENLAIAASGLMEFLTFETALSLLELEPPGREQALATLDVPPELRSSRVTDRDAVATLACWADPALERLGPPAERDGVSLDDIAGTVTDTLE